MQHQPYVQNAGSLREQRSNGKTVAVKYSEYYSEDGTSMTRYRVFVDGKPYPFGVDLPKDLLLLIHGKYDGNIFRIFSDAIFEQIRSVTGTPATKVRDVRTTGTPCIMSFY